MAAPPPPAAGAPPAAAAPSPLGAPPAAADGMPNPPSLTSIVAERPPLGDRPAFAKASGASAAAAGATPRSVPPVSIFSERSVAQLQALETVALFGGGDGGGGDDSDSDDGIEGAGGSGAADMPPRARRRWWRARRVREAFACVAVAAVFCAGGAVWQVKAKVRRRASVLAPPLAAGQGGGCRAALECTRACRGAPSVCSRSHARTHAHTRTHTARPPPPQTPGYLLFYFIAALPLTYAIVSWAVHILLLIWEVRGLAVCCRRGGVGASTVCDRPRRRRRAPRASYMTVYVATPRPTPPRSSGSTSASARS